MSAFVPLLSRAISARAAFLDPPHDGAFRLFNGFQEGFPGLVMDVYASTLVIFNLGKPAELLDPLILEGMELIHASLPWLHAVLVKKRHTIDPAERRGQLLSGAQPDHKVLEHDCWYALDLALRQDAGLYLDTRNLRKWASETLRGRTALNTFAYTGSLGVAAISGGASRVVHLDLSREVLNLAKASYTLNGFPIHKEDFIVGDFFVHTSRLKRDGEQFDCVFLDPPYFSTTHRSRLDLNTDSARLINKVRPLVKDGGWLVAINNSLYVSGREYISTLERLCTDGYLMIADLIPVPEDITGFEATRSGQPVTDPYPFNHPTKIALLEVRRKSP